MIHGVVRFAYDAIAVVSPYRSCVLGTADIRGQSLRIPADELGGEYQNCGQFRLRECNLCFADHGYLAFIPPTFSGADM